MRKYLFILLYSFSSVLYAQKVSVRLGKNQIAANEAFQIVLTIENQRLQSYSAFPNIDGFSKGGTSSSTHTNIINGSVSSTQSVTQTYYPTKQGNFRLNDFTIKVNGKTVQARGITIKVGPPSQRQQYDPWADFFGKPRRNNNNIQDFIDVKDNAFFSITSNKKEVYVGEGLNISISFFVAIKNKAEMEFYQIGEQLADMLKKVKPANCWEENFEIEQISPKYVTINGEKFREYRVYQATFYPLNTQDIVIPAMGLKMIKYKRAKRRSSFFFGSNKQKDFKTFYSKKHTIKVKPLPAHPLIDKVNVGNFVLKEKISTKQVHTSQSLIYEFTVQGEGNTAAIKQPQIIPNEDFIFYSPNIEQQINRGNDKVFGSKTFKFYTEPQEPGDYSLSDYMYWVYFNPIEASYDTLKPKITLNVSGQSKKNAAIAQNDLGIFYNDIDNESNILKKTTERAWVSVALNLSGLLFIAACAFLLVKK